MKKIIKKLIISRLENYYIQPWWMKRAYYDCMRREIVMVAFPLNYIVSLAWWLNLKWGEFRHKPTWLDAIIKQRAETREAAKLITMDESLYAAKCIEVYATITPEGIEDLWPPEIQRIIHEMHEIGERLKGNDSQQNQ